MTIAKLVFDAGLSDVRHTGSQRREVTPLLEGPDGLSWQGRSDDHVE